MALISCRVTTNIVGARAGQQRLVDPEDPQVAMLIEKGFLVPDGEAVAESGDGASGERHADEPLDAGAAVGNDADAPLEPVGDGVDELTLPAT